MNNQDQVPTIAELWEELQSYIDFFTRHTLSGNPHDLGEMQSLRQQLLERCGQISGTYGDIHTIGFDSSGLEVIGNGSVWVDSFGAKEISSAYAFWAWELEQREKEASGD